MEGNTPMVQVIHQTTMGPRKEQLPQSSAILCALFASFVKELYTDLIQHTVCHTDLKQHMSIAHIICDLSLKTSQSHYHKKV